MRTVKMIAAFVTGFTFLAPATYAMDSEAARMLSALSGSYRLVETDYGHCESTIQLGMGRDGQSFRAARHDFRGFNMGRQRFYSRGWEIESDTRLGLTKMEMDSKRYSRASDTKIKEEVSFEMDDGLIQYKIDRKTKFGGDKTKFKAKCKYMRVADFGDIDEGEDKWSPGKGEQEDKGEWDEGQKDHGEQDEGQQDKGGK